MEDVSASVPEQDAAVRADKISEAVNVYLFIIMAVEISDLVFFIMRYEVIIQK